MGIIPITHLLGHLLQWKALPHEELNYNLLEMLWFYLALALVSFFMVSLLPGSITKKLILFVNGVILDSNKEYFC